MAPFVYLFILFTTMTTYTFAIHTSTLNNYKNCVSENIMSYDMLSNSESKKGKHSCVVNVLLENG